MRVRSACAAAALIAHTFAPPANAQDLSAYPNREIRSVCNFAAGSGADVLVRFYSDRLAKLTGNPVIVDNRPGAQGSLATEFVAKSKSRCRRYPFG